MARLKQYKKGVKIKLSKNFSSTEFDCKCKNPDCQYTYVDLDHVENLQKLRDKVKRSVEITSGYRCPKHNKAVGGATKSRHTLHNNKDGADATDIKVKGMLPDHVAEAAEKLEFKGIGRYDTFTHLDSRPNKARWDFRKK